jgi:hypothetical protein
MVKVLRLVIVYLALVVWVLGVVVLKMVLNVILDAIRVRIILNAQ